MDFDPRITSDDLILEEVENEKACVQVLKIMIAKADDEIRDLEDELAILQCQLKWNKSDKRKGLYEVCCATFKQKIDSLTSLIQRLKDENVIREHIMNEGIEIQGPAERICDIITTLIRSDFPDPLEQDKQPRPVVSAESSSVSVRYTAKDTMDQRYMSKPDEDVSRKVGIDASRFSSKEKSVALPSKPVVTQTPLLVSSAESSGSSPSSASAEMKAEKDNYTKIASDSSSKLQHHGRDIPVGDHLKRKLHSDLDAVQESIPTPMPKPLESTSNTENYVQPHSFFNTERESLFFHKRAKRVRDSGTKKQQLQRVKKEKVPVVSPVSDLDDLKRKVSQDPNFMKNLKVAQLKEIAKQNKWTGLTKMKKECMIEEMIKRLGP